VLHTWNQRLQFHPHVHCVTAAGGLAPDHLRWIPSRNTFFLPVDALSEVFRGKFEDGLKAAFRHNQLKFRGDLAPLTNPRAFARWCRTLFRHKWVVYAKPPFGGPEHALRYLSAYTHRIAISNRRLVALDQGNVTFRWRDSAHANKQRLLTLPVDEFLRRFLLHLLPRGFVRIRNFGFLANRRRARLLPLCFLLLASAADVPAQAASPARDDPCTSTYWNCPVCGGSMHVVERLTAAHPFMCRMRQQLEPRSLHLPWHGYPACGLSGSHCLRLFRASRSGDRLKLVRRAQLRISDRSACGNPPSSHPRNQPHPIQYP
jgi:hypothetical protein